MYFSPFVSLTVVIIGTTVIVIVGISIYLVLNMSINK
jgi:hypothetical protein